MGLLKKAPVGKAAKAKSNAPILVASNVTDETGKIIYTAAQVAESIKGYAEGKALEKQGTTLMETHKAVLGEFARRGFAARWVEDQTRPSSPKLFAGEDTAKSAGVTMSFIDRSVNIDDNQLSELQTLIGDEAESLIESYTQYTIDAKIASKTLTINGEEATIQDHFEKALINYFPEEHHGLISDMLKPKAVRQTKKGMIDKLLSFAGKGPGAITKLANLLVKSRTIVAYKAIGTGEDE
jgi:hypothetical protein